MSEGFTVLVTGPVRADVERVALEIDGRLRARGLATELIDSRAPGAGEDAATFAAGALARHGVVTVLALPVPARAARDRAREALGRFVEVYVRAEGGAGPGYEPPERAEVEVALPEHGAGAGADRTLRTLELLGFLDAEEGGAYSDDEEREVIKRLKAFGYL
jgi:adenylylsulfate kinase